MVADSGFSRDRYYQLSSRSLRDFAARLDVRRKRREEPLDQLLVAHKRENNKEFSMTVLKPARLIGTVAVLAAIPLLSAVAQTQSPAPAETSPPPAVTKPETTMPPAQRPATSPASVPDKAVTAPGKQHPLVGLAAISSDGSNLGSVQKVVAGPDGKASAIHLKVGGFLGFGGKVVAITSSKFNRSGDKIQVGMTADEISKLPEAKEVN